jgi:hypothetical protein
MHRQMVIQVNKMVADTPYERIVGWKNCPFPGDPRWPVPAAYDTGDASFTAEIANSKTEDFFWETIMPQDEKLWDHEYLKTISLGKLGAQVEFTIHNWMHMRFSEIGTVGLRNIATANPSPNIDPKWDNLAYRWLGDTYSAHVNPIFWKIHGWVDDHIEEWRKANGLNSIPWKYTWQNGPEAAIQDLFAAGDVTDGDDGSGASDLEPDQEMLIAMAKVVKIMLELGKDTHLKPATVSP